MKTEAATGIWTEIDSVVALADMMAAVMVGWKAFLRAETSDGDLAELKALQKAKNKVDEKVEL